MQKHISVTQLKMFLRCPLQFKYRYVDGLRIPPTGSLLLGKSIHSALEGNYSQKIETKQDLSMEQVTSLFSDRWEKEVKETSFDNGEKSGKVKDDGVNLISTYHSQISPTITPKFVEKGFDLSFSNVSYTLKGFIDLVDVDEVIVDHKTAKRSMSQDGAASDLQLTCYALAYRSLFGRPEKELRFDVMVRNKTPKMQQISSTRSQEDIDRFLKMLAYVSKAIESGIFYPNQNFMCGVCGFKELCRKW